MSDKDAAQGDGRVRRKVHYSGRVQGVGFRYTTCDVARAFDVVGFVRNLADGRVEMVVEGAAGEVERFQNAVARAMERNISGTNVMESRATGEFTRFGVRH